MIQLRVKSRFQKESPYLEDTNELILLAHQMGLIDRLFKNNEGNATKCSTRSGVRSTNTERDQKRVLEIKDIYGMLILITIGLSGALLVFVGECIIHKVNCTVQKMKKRVERKSEEESRPIEIVELSE